MIFGRHSLDPIAAIFQYKVDVKYKNRTENTPSKELNILHWRRVYEKYGCTPVGQLNRDHHFNMRFGVFYAGY